MSEELQLHEMVVADKKVIANDIHLFVLKDVDGKEVEPFEAGAHIAIRVPSGAMRQYSLCNAPSDRTQYQIAVKREADGRGGSVSLVDKVSIGDRLEVAKPSNLFGLDPKAKKFLFIAGGIGITPMMAMMRELMQGDGRTFSLIYFTRDEASTAFRETLAGESFRDKCRIVHTRSQSGKEFDLWSVLERPVSGTHVYCCGPKRLMDSVKDMTGHWAANTIHMENFGADTKPHPNDREFEVVLRSCGKHIKVGKTQSILEALRTHQIRVPSSCESGTCGSCKVAYVEGDVDHRDLALLDEEKSTQIIVCVSRAASDVLVLDL